MRALTFATEHGALDACAKIDAALGYPKEEQGSGPPVLTERWALPIALVDGWAVPVSDEIEAMLGNEVATTKRGEDLDLARVYRDESEAM